MLMSHLSRVECPLQPLGAPGLDQHNIESTRRQLAQAHQIVTRRKDNASLFDHTDARTGAAMLGARALAHLDKHGGAIVGTHDQVDFSTTAPGRPIIALQQVQPVLLQIPQRRVFSRSADLPGAWGFGPELRTIH